MSIYCLPLSPCSVIKISQKWGICLPCSLLYSQHPNSAWPGTGLRTLLQEETGWEDRVGVGEGEEKQGETLTVPLSSRAGTHKWTFAHPHPSPGSFPSLRTLGATLGQHPGAEVGRLAFFAWAQRQTSPGLSDLSAEQLINPESEIRWREKQG